MAPTPILLPLRLTAPLSLYLGYLLMGTLYPFEFDTGPLLTRLSQFMQRLHNGPYVLFTGDFLTNILLFIPFGIIVSLNFPVRLRKKIWPIVLAALVACFLSSAIEFVQLFARNRHSSAADIVSNTVGGLAGSLVVRFWPRILRPHLPSRNPVKAAWHAILALSFLLAWLPALIPVVFPNWHLPGLWADDVTLNAGNDYSLTHPWHGRLHRVAIYDRALDAVEVRRTFQTRQPQNEVLVFYDFDESESSALVDRTGRAGSLHLKGRGALRWRPKGGGVQLRHPARLSTSAVSGRQLSASLLNSREFSLEAWITPRNVFQRGPALILSLSGSGDNFNAILGQSTKDLVFWVRTPVSGMRLTALSATTMSQPLTRNLTHVMAVFREGRLMIFVNGVQSGTLDLKREAMIGLPTKRTNGARVAYAFLYFFPLALFWSSLLSRTRLGIALGPLSPVAAWLALPAAVLSLLVGEVIQASGAGRAFDSPYLFFGIAVTAVAAALGRLSSPNPPSG